MKELQVEIVRSNGELTFRFVESELVARKVIVENIVDVEVEAQQKWWVVVTDSDSNKKRKGPVTVRLLRRIDVPKIQIVESLEGFWIELMKLRHIQILLLSGKDVMLVGQQGTGKTDFAFRLAKAWGCKICKVDCGTLQTPSSLFGWEAAEDGKTIWRPSEFYRFCQEAWQQPKVKFLLLLDEISRMHAKMAEGLHGLYDQTRQVSITTSEGTIVIKMPPNVMTIATRNRGAKFTGTYTMDAALADRFVTIELSYLPLEVERGLLVDRYGIHPHQAEIVVKVARSLREAEQQGLLSTSPSPRLTDAAAALVAHNETVADSIETALLGIYERGVVLAGEAEKEEENEYHRAKSHIRKFKFAKDLTLMAVA